MGIGRGGMVYWQKCDMIMGIKMQYSSRTISLSFVQENLRQADDKDGTLARSFKCRVNLTFTVFTVQAG